MSANQIQRVSSTICNTLWGNQLSFHAYKAGDPPVEFRQLWPKEKVLIETCQLADLGPAGVYELCKLLLVAEHAAGLDSLLRNRVILADQSFEGKCANLAHLVCALGSKTLFSVLMNRGTSTNGLWAQKDEEGHTPVDVCFSSELRSSIPFFKRPLFSKAQSKQLPLSAAVKERIFQNAFKPDMFYKFLVDLQVYAFDVNKERDDNGDLLIHCSVKQGLSSLPILLLLCYKFNADPTKYNEQGLTPLCLAAKLGEEKIAQVLVCVFRSDVNTPDLQNHWTPLHYAAKHNQPIVINMLVGRGAELDREDAHNCVPSLLARKDGLSECEHLINNHLRDRKERLSKEAINGTLEVSKLYPSDLTMVNEEGHTLLMLAVVYNQEALVKDLVRMPKCPLNYRQIIGVPEVEGSVSLKTAVAMAAETGYERCLRLLLEAGADPSIPDSQYWLPIHHSTEHGHLECVRAIVECPYHQGLTGLHLAVGLAETNHNKEILRILRAATEKRQVEVINPVLFEVALNGDRERISKLIETGDDVNPMEEKYNFMWPLMLAAEKGHAGTVMELHQHGGEMSREHSLTQSTPLHCACTGGSSEVVRYILSVEESLNINQRNGIGATPLQLASALGHLEVLKELLDHGASTTLPDSNGRLVNCPAFAKGQYEIERYRKRHRSRLVKALSNRKMTLREFQQMWDGPCDFNLRTPERDTMLMEAAQHSSPEILRFLLQSADKARPDMLMLLGNESTPLASTDSTDDSISYQSDTSLTINMAATNITTAAAAGATVSMATNGTDSMATMTAGGEGGGRRKARTTDGGRRKRMANAVGARTEFSPAHWSPKGAPPPMASMASVESWRVQGNRPQAPTFSSIRNEKRSPLAQQYPGIVKSEATLTPDTPHVSTVTEDFSTSHTLTPSTLCNGEGGGGGEEEGEEGEEGEGGGEGEDGVSRDNSSSSTETTLQPVIVKLTNPHGHTCLHKAAMANQTENVGLLLTLVPYCANLPDKEGNTALHLACMKGHKNTVKAMLTFDCVSASLRNSSGQFPEECAQIKSKYIKKIVTKRRKVQTGSGFPSPPNSLIGEGSAPVAAESIDLSLTAFDAQMERLRQDLKQNSL